MSTEKLVGDVARHITRRRVLVRLGGGVIATALGLMAIPQAAHAQLVPYACCNLCLSPTGGCQGTCVCTWCWGCCHTAAGGGDNSVYECCECYRQSGEDCDSDCQGVDCSYANRVGPSGSCGRRTAAAM